MHSNPEDSSTTKTNKYTASGYSLFTPSSFDATKNRHDYYRGKYCMKTFFELLKDNAAKIKNYEKKKK